MPLELLETEVLQKLLEGDHPVLEKLREQIPGLSVNAREHTEVGFFTKFTVRDGALPATSAPDNIKFGDVEAKIAGLEHGAGFLLYIEKGFLYMLEGYSYEERWPRVINDFSLKYSIANRSAELAKLE
jgi:hypothetical protein